MKSLLDPQIISILISGSVAKKKNTKPHTKQVIVPRILP